jgi:hypothetical protein
VRASSEPSERDADEALWGPIADIFGIRYPATVSPDSQPPATDPAPAVIYEELAAKGSQPPAITEPKADSPEGGEKDADSDEPEFSWLPLVEEPPDISEVPADSPQGDGGDTSPPKELSDSARAPEVGGVIVDVDITDNPPAIGQVLIREVYGIPVLGDPDPSFPEHLPKGDERRDMQPGIDFSEVPEAAVTAALEDILDRLKRHVWPDEKGFEEGAPRGTRKIQVTEEEVVSGGIWELVKRALSSEGQRDEG